MNALRDSGLLSMAQFTRSKMLNDTRLFWDGWIIAFEPKPPTLSKIAQPTPSIERGQLELAHHVGLVPAVAGDHVHNLLLHIEGLLYLHNESPRPCPPPPRHHLTSVPHVKGASNSCTAGWLSASPGIT